MNNAARILIIDDEPEITRVLKAALEAQDYQVKTSANAKDALKQCAHHPPELVILDLGLPDLDGKEVISSLRGWSQMPIVVLSARDREEEKVKALELGADDYLTKPFGTAELLARVKVALRHAVRREGDGTAVYEAGGLRVDLAKRLVSLDSAAVQLTPTEYSLLACLTRKAGQVVTHAELLREVWGRNADEQDHGHYLRIYVKHLREKLHDDPTAPRFIFTEPGIGYRLREG